MSPKGETRQRPYAGSYGQQGSLIQGKKTSCNNTATAAPFSARSSLRNTPHFGRNGSGRPMVRVASEERLEMSRNLARDEFESQGPLLDSFGSQRPREGQMMRASSSRDLQPEGSVMSDRTETLSQGQEGMAVLHGQIEEMKHERETLHRALGDVRQKMQEMQSWYESRINQLESRLDQAPLAAAPVSQQQQQQQQSTQGLTEADLRRLNNFCRKEVEVAELRKKIDKVKNCSSAQIHQLDQHFRNQMHVLRNEFTEMLSGSPVREEGSQTHRRPPSRANTARRGRSESPQGIGTRAGRGSSSMEYAGAVQNERRVARPERQKSPSPPGSPLAVKAAAPMQRATVAVTQASSAQQWPSAAVTTAPGPVREGSPGPQGGRMLYKAHHTASHPALPHAQQLGSVDGVAAPMSPRAVLGGQHHPQAAAIQSWAPQMRAPGEQQCTRASSNATLVGSAMAGGPNSAPAQQPQRIVQVLAPPHSSRVSFGYSPRTMISSPLRRGPPIS